MKNILLFYLSLNSVVLFSQNCDSVYNWKWDSHDWTLKTKQIFTYDTQDSLLTDEIKAKSILEDSMFTSHSKSIYLYDLNHRLIKKINQTQQDTSLLNFSQIIYSYDANGNILTELHQLFVSSSWENSSVFTYNYNSLNNRVYKLYQFWNNLSWQNYSQTFYSYNSNNNLAGESSQHWDGTSWIDNPQHFYFYNSNNQKTSEITLNANNTDTLYRLKYFYNTNQNLVEYLEQTKNNTSGIWQNIFHELYSYDLNNNRSSTVRELWSNGWNSYMHIDYTYDSNNYCSSLFQKNWNGSILENKFKYTYSHNLYGKRLSYISESWENNQWVKGDSSYYYYSNTATEIKPFVEEFSNALLIYPNPTSRIVNIELPCMQSVKIYVLDSQGNCVMKQECYGHSIQQLDLSKAAKGVYYIEIIADDKKEVQKIILN